MQETIKLLMMQLIADAKDEFMNEFRDIVKEVLENDLQTPDSESNFLMQRMTYTQISKEYHVSENSLKKWKKQGLLIPICKGGKSFLFERGDVEECLRNRPRTAPNFKKAS